MDFQPGQQVDHFVLVRRLGQGGQGEVWMAADRLQPGYVALKRVIPTPGRKTDLERARREAYRLAHLQHPGLVRCHKLIERPPSEELILVMDLAEGSSLDRLLGDPRLSAHHRIKLLIHTARALAALHEAGIIHRDLKPENIVVSDRFWIESDAPGVVKLVDLGISVEIGNPAPLTQHNRVIGTAPFMAPETLAPMAFYNHQSPGPTPAVDVFAWGIFAWKLLLGGHPTGLPDGASMSDFVAVYLEGRGNAAWATTPPSAPLGPLLRDCLRLDPATRIPDAAGILRRLYQDGDAQTAEALRSQTEDAPAPSPPPASRRSVPAPSPPPASRRSVPDSPSTAPASQHAHTRKVTSTARHAAAVAQQASPSARHAAAVAQQARQGSQVPEAPSPVSQRSTLTPLQAPAVTFPESRSSWSEGPPSQGPRASIPPAPSGRSRRKKGQRGVWWSLPSLLAMLGLGAWFGYYFWDPDLLFRGVTAPSPQPTEVPVVPAPTSPPTSKPRATTAPPARQPCACDVAKTSKPCASKRSTTSTLACGDRLAPSSMWNLRLSFVAMNDGATKGESLAARDRGARVRICVQGTQRCQEVPIQETVNASCGGRHLLAVTAEELSSPGLLIEAIGQDGRSLGSAVVAHEWLGARALCDGVVFAPKPPGALQRIGFFLEDP
jgi:serine/threonine protein kinase